MPFVLLLDIFEQSNINFILFFFVFCGFFFWCGGGGGGGGGNTLKQVCFVTMHVFKLGFLFTFMICTFRKVSHFTCS